MSINKKYLNVSFSLERQAVTIYGNYEGLALLKDALESLLDPRTKVPEDVSLMSPEWGGRHLDADPDVEDSIHHLRIYRIE